MKNMKKHLLAGVLFFTLFFMNARVSIALVGYASPTVADEKIPQATASAIFLESMTPTPLPPRPDLTRETEESVEPLKKILDTRKLGTVFPFNPIKYAIRGAVDAGVPPNTLVLLLLLPGVAALIAAARHLIGIRGFGIFLPAALAVTFVATGPLAGIGLFLVIVFIATMVRIILRKLKVKLQYLPRMALILWSVVLGVLGILFLAPFTGGKFFGGISIFPVLILALLAEDFTKVQLGKSAKIAVKVTGETLILALVSYFILTSITLHEFALLHPEVTLLTTALVDIILGRYIGLRFLEFWRFRKLINGRI